MNIDVSISIINEFGTYTSNTMTISEEEYKNLVDFSKVFFESAFDMELKSGGTIIIPPELIKKSIMIIDIIS